jgi:hypothetical protein
MVTDPAEVLNRKHSFVLTKLVYYYNYYVSGNNSITTGISKVARITVASDAKVFNSFALHI